MQFEECNVLPYAGPCSAPKCHHVLVHVVCAHWVHPAIRVEFVRILTEDSLIKMHDGCVDSNRVAFGDELSAKLDAPAWDGSWQGCIGEALEQKFSCVRWKMKRGALA